MAENKKPTALEAIRAAGQNTEKTNGQYTSMSKEERLRFFGAKSAVKKKDNGGEEQSTPSSPSSEEQSTQYGVGSMAQSVYDPTKDVVEPQRQQAKSVEEITKEALAMKSEDFMSPEEKAVSQAKQQGVEGDLELADVESKAKVVEDVKQRYREEGRGYLVDGIDDKKRKELKQQYLEEAKAEKAKDILYQNMPSGSIVNMVRGFGEGFGEYFKKIDQSIDAKTVTPEIAENLLEDIYLRYQAEQEVNPDFTTKDVGKFLGEISPSLLAVIIPSIMSGGGSIPMMAAGALEGGTRGSAQGLIDGYIRARSEDKSQEEALTIARNQSENQSNIEGLAQASIVLNSPAAKAGQRFMTKLGLNSNAWQKAGRIATEALVVDAPIAGGSQVAINKSLQDQGLDVDLMEGVPATMALGTGIGIIANGMQKVDAIESNPNLTRAEKDAAIDELATITRQQLDSSPKAPEEPALKADKANEQMAKKATKAKKDDGQPKEATTPTRPEGEEGSMPKTEPSKKTDKGAEDEAVIIPKKKTGLQKLKGNGDDLDVLRSSNGNITREEFASAIYNDEVYNAKKRGNYSGNVAEKINRQYKNNIKSIKDKGELHDLDESAFQMFVEHRKSQKNQSVREQPKKATPKEVKSNQDIEEGKVVTEPEKQVETKVKSEKQSQTDQTKVDTTPETKTEVKSRPPSFTKETKPDEAVIAKMQKNPKLAKDARDLTKPAFQEKHKGDFNTKKEAGEFYEKARTELSRPKQATPKVEPKKVGQDDQVNVQAKPESPKKSSDLKYNDDTPVEMKGAGKVGNVEAKSADLGEVVVGEKGFKGAKPSESIFMNQGDKYGRVNLLADEDYLLSYRAASSLGKANNKSPISPKKANEIAKKYGFKDAYDLMQSTKKKAKEVRSENSDTILDLRTKPEPPKDVVKERGESTAGAAKRASIFDAPEKFLDDMEKRVDSFSKNTLSSGIHVPAAKVAIAAARQAIKAGKAAEEAIRAAIEAVRKTDWYKGLKNKKDAERIVRDLMEGRADLEAELKVEPPKKSTPKEAKESNTFLPSKKEMQEAVLTGKEKQSSYGERVKRGEKGDIIGIEDTKYEQQSNNKARKAANDIVSKTKTEKDVDQLFAEVKKGIENNDIPASLQAPLLEEVSNKYFTMGLDSKSVDAYRAKKELGTPAGQIISSFSNDGNPKAIAYKKSKEILEEKFEKIGDDKGELLKLRKELQMTKDEFEQFKAEVDKKINDAVKKATGKTPQQAARARSTARRKAADSAIAKLRALKKTDKNTLNDITEVVGTAVYNKAIDTIIAGIDAGVRLTNLIDESFTNLKANYKGNISKDAFEAHVRSQFSDAELKILDKPKDAYVKKKLKDMGLKINEIINSHWTDVENIGKKLSDRLVDEAELTPEQARLLAQEIEQTYTRVIKDKQKAVLEQKFGAPKDAKPKEKKKAQARIEKIIEDLNKGVLTDETYLDAFADAYGFRKIPVDARAKLNEFVDRINSLEDFPELQKREMIAMYDYMAESGMDKPSAADVILEMMYVGALSSPRTFGNALIGGLHTSISDSVSKLFTQPPKATLAALKAGVDAYRVRSTGSALKTAIDTFKKNWTIFTGVMKDGFAAIDYKDTPRKGSGWVDRKTRETYKSIWTDSSRTKLTKAADLALKSFWYPLNRVYYGLLALDQSMMYGLRDYNAALIAFNDMTTRSKSVKDRIKEMNELIFKHKEAEFEAQAKAEVESLKKQGIKVPDGYEKRRAVELRYMNMSEELARRSMDESKKALLMNDPENLMGNVYRRLVKESSPLKSDSRLVAARKLAVAGLFLIKRVPANFISMSYDFSPFKGIIQASEQIAGIAPSKKTRSGKVELSNFEIRTNYAKSAIGTAAMTVAYSIFFDYEDGKMKVDENATIFGQPIKIYGSGYGINEYATNLQNEEGFESWTLKIGDTRIPLKYSPLGLVLAPIAVMSDELRLKDFHKKVNNQEHLIRDRKAFTFLSGVAASAMIGFLTSQSYQMQLRNLLSAGTSFISGNWDRGLQNTSSLLSSPVKTVALPSLYRDIINNTRAYMDIPEKKKQQIYDSFIDDIPLAQNIIQGDMYDVFGYPIIKDFDLPLVPEFIERMIKENLTYREGEYAWELLHSSDKIKTSNFTIDDYFETSDGEQIKLTDYQKSEYSRILGEAFRELVEWDKTIASATDGELQPMLSLIKKGDEESLIEAQARLNSYRLDARENGKMDFEDFLLGVTE